MFTVVTGGSGSGKSAYAEDVICSLWKKEQEIGKRKIPLFYIATMYPFDEESHKRIERHRDMRRGKGFETIECYTGLKEKQFPEGCCVLLECMSNLTANEMFREEGAKEKTVEAIKEGLQRIQEKAAHICVVTNEIFSEAAVYEGDTCRYQEYLGEINQFLGKTADEVCEVVYGIPLLQKTAEKKAEGKAEEI